MKFRTSEIMISKGVRRCLVAIAKVEGKESTTADEVGDNVLKLHLVEKYPALWAHQQQIEKLED